MNHHRKGNITSIGDSVPEPLGFNAFQPEWLDYTEGTRTEDKAPQGCDLSAASSAGMARAASTPEPSQTQTQTRRTVSLLEAKNGLDNRVHFIRFN